MSARKSRLRKIIRKADRMERKQNTLREQNRKPGESDEEMEARMKRDLGGWLDMMSEREIKEALEKAEKEARLSESAIDNQVKE